MKRLWNKYKAWRTLRREHLQWWERKRARGKARFVIQTALVFGVSMIVAMSVLDYYFDGAIAGRRLLSRAIYYAIVGPIIGFVIWWSHEGRYNNLKIEARIHSDAE